MSLNHTVRRSRGAGRGQGRIESESTNAHDESAQQLVATKERIYAANRHIAELASADRLTAADLKEALALAAELDAACEEFRRRFYPRRHQVFTALGSVLTTSKAGRRTEIVYDQRSQAGGAL